MHQEHRANPENTRRKTHIYIHILKYKNILLHKNQASFIPKKKALFISLMYRMFYTKQYTKKLKKRSIRCIFMHHICSSQANKGLLCAIAYLQQEMKSDITANPVKWDGECGIWFKTQCMCNFNEKIYIFHSFESSKHITGQ